MLSINIVIIPFSGPESLSDIFNFLIRIKPTKPKPVIKSIGISYMIISVLRTVIILLKDTNTSESINSSKKNSISISDKLPIVLFKKS
jgi:hypothetical protein